MICIGGVVAVGLGLFFMFLFVIPGFKPAGITGVAVNSKYMTYFGDEIDYMFRQRNLMIESANTQININVRKIGFEDESRLVLFENAAGIAFNSVHRTQVNLTEIIGDDGVPYTKIRLIEPKGAVSRKATLYVNLTRTLENLPYNITLNTGNSNVKFDYDPSAEYMRIDNLNVYGTGLVTLPAPIRATAKNPTPFEMSVGNLNIDSSGARVNCRSTITGVVRIKGITRSVVLGDIQSPASATTSLQVSGVKHTVTAANINKNVVWGATSGSLKTGDIFGNLDVQSENVSLNVRSTNHLNLKSERGSIRVNRIATTSLTNTIVMEKGSLTLGSRGTSNSIPMGVYGNVDIQKPYGGMTVNFADAAHATGTTKIRAIDGNVVVYRARGAVDILIASSGNANVTASFAGTTWSSGAVPDLFPSTSRIIVEGSRNQSSGGKVTVGFFAGVGASMHFRGTSHITGNLVPTSNDLEPRNCRNADHKTASRPNNILEDWQCNGDCGQYLYPVRLGGALLHVKTQNTVTVRSF